MTDRITLDDVLTCIRVLRALRAHPRADDLLDLRELPADAVGHFETVYIGYDGNRDYAHIPLTEIITESSAESRALRVRRERALKIAELEAERDQLLWVVARPGHLTAEAKKAEEQAERAAVTLQEVDAALVALRAEEGDNA